MEDSKILKIPFWNKNYFFRRFYSLNNLIKILLIIWIPLPFLNFDDHHDGLILSTLQLTKTAILERGEYPFNQYGPSWILPFLLLSFLVPNDFLFIAIRIFVVIIYIFSAFLLWRISLLFLEKKSAKIVIILFLGSQPFTTDFGSTLVPWPSAVIMPVVLAVSYFSLSQFPGLLKNFKISMAPLYAGLLIPTIVFSRLQVGISLLILTLFSLRYSKIYLRKTQFFTGLFISCLSLFLYLVHFGWFKEAFYDQIIFGSTYLTADKSTFPKPIFTFFGVFIFLAILMVAPKVIVKSQPINLKKILIIISIGILLMFITLFYLISERQISPLSAMVTLTRRFWITLGLASLIFTSIKICVIKIKNYQKPDITIKNLKTLEFLLLYALSFQSQIIPLFDQMHFWWGSPLTFLIIVIMFKNRFELTNSEILKKGILNILAILILLSSIFVPWFAQLSAEKIKLPHEIDRHIYAPSIEAHYQSNLQLFFHLNIPKDAKVLNLCDSSNIFFQSSQFRSASRFFVFWGEQMSEAPGLIQSLKDSRPNFVLTCELSHAPGLQLSQEKIQKSIVEKILVNSDEYISYTERSNKIWQIYKVNETYLNNIK